MREEQLLNVSVSDYTRMQECKKGDGIRSLLDKFSLKKETSKQKMLLKHHLSH